GGWPLTVFLLPDLQPFYAGTYYPPEDRFGRPGYRRVLLAGGEAYRSRRADVDRRAAELTRAIATVTTASGDPCEPPPVAARRAARAALRRYDDRHGGFGDRPKFPSTMTVEALLRAHLRGEPEMLQRVRQTLDGMRQGGIHDQLGGGFHRYSTDERWLVPHFERMLYDNALLARLYVDGWRATGDEAYRETARGVLAYVEREMRSPEGLFYSSQDADSDGREGAFFVWRPEELVEVLGEDDARVAALAFGVSEGGNFVDPHSGEEGASVLHVNRPLSAVAAQLGRPLEEVEARFGRARRALFEAREARPKPFRDEKVIATWNGLMIGAFALAGGAFGDAGLVATARHALDAVRARLWADGGLRRLAKDGEAKGDAFLEDYADLAGAALDVQQATLAPAPLAFARALVDAALARFWDEAEGLFYFTARGAQDVVVRAADASDNAVPSGTSSMAHALLRLHALTGEDAYRRVAETVLRRYAAAAVEHPLGHGHLVAALDRYVHGPVEVVVVAADDDPAGDALAAAARGGAYVPDLVLARLAPGADENDGAVGRALEGRRQVEGRATAYVCRGMTCSAPVTGVDALRALLVA
ncbi:MAG: thioredoxin domain-containing protein, partial [Sandaracinaceae bacterium]